MSRRVFTLITILLALCSCGGNSPGAQVLEGDLLLSVPNTEVKASAGQQFIKVTAFSDWSLEFDFQGSDPWASADCISGSGNKAGIILSWESFDAEGESRSVTLTLLCKDKSSTVTFTQNASSESQGGSSTGGSASDIRSESVPVWMELPATDREDLYFITHDMTLSNGAKSRNYSIYYDTSALLSFWVAYPLNSSLIGSGSRTNEWGYDPKVPSKYQPMLFGGFKGYDRGHQIPSADRLKRDANVQTFYFTNMTAQKGSLNQNSWATLEGKVRGWATSFDTLYVVTGADYARSTERVSDNEGKSVTVPTAYFKALLGYKKTANIGNSTKGYLGIGFYFEHKAYDDSQIMSTCAMTLDELEKKLGTDLFVNLPAAVGEETAAKIESTRDSWWK